MRYPFGLAKIPVIVCQPGQTLEQFLQHTELIRHRGMNEYRRTLLDRIKALQVRWAARKRFAPDDGPLQSTTRTTSAWDLGMGSFPQHGLNSRRPQYVSSFVQLRLRYHCWVCLTPHGSEASTAKRATCVPRDRPLEDKGKSPLVSNNRSPTETRLTTDYWYGSSLCVVLSRHGAWDVGFLYSL